ncbi:TPA: fimbrial protein [Salmonella enterica subsp. enterica serovar Litchfield]
MKKIMHKRRLSLWGGVMLLLVPVLYSGAARAAELPNGCQLGTTYTGDKGAEPANIKVPMKITLNQDTPEGSVVYEETLPSMKYVCKTFGPSVSPSIIGGDNFFKGFSSDLQKAGLRIEYTINGNGPFTPTRTDFFAIDSYPQAGAQTYSGTLRGSFRLILDKKPDRPLNQVIARIDDILRLVYGRIGNNYVSFGTSNATQIYYVPKCVGKVSVPAVVDLGRVITGGKGSLPSPRNFYINTSFNHDCAGFNDISTWGGFSLTLEIKFSAAGADDKTTSSSLILYNDDGQKNGLQLVIKEAGSKTVTFGKWSPVSPAITPNDLPLNLFYTASLEPTGSVTSAVTGKFSQNVTVKVRYQ